MINVSSSRRINRTIVINIQLLFFVVLSPIIRLNLIEVENFFAIVNELRNYREDQRIMLRLYRYML